VKVHAQEANKAANTMTTNTVAKTMQGHRNENGSVRSQRSGISSEFCLFVVANASFSKLLEYKKIDNSILWYCLQRV